MADYHLFKKPRVKNGKIIRKWYYYYVVNGKQIQKSCKRCATKAEAEAFIQKLPRRSGINAVLVKTVTENMFVPGSDHMKRRIQLGRPLQTYTMKEARHKMKIMMELWGDRTLESLTVEEVGNYLFSVEKSGSWKKLFTNNLKEVYAEAAWHGCKIPVPVFPKFVKKVKKADILLRTNSINCWSPKTFPRRKRTCSFYVYCPAGCGLARRAP
jgi:hypothetical protein